jgi:DNA repair protein RadA/Sms
LAKVTTRFVCQSCGVSSPKWMGRCTECGEWNSMVEETIRSAPTSLAASIARGGGTLEGAGRFVTSFMGAAQSGPRPITEIEAIAHDRSTTCIGEFDRVLGGGVVPGSLVLIGGDPGIGKCLAGSERVLDPATGDYLPITEWADHLRPVLALDTETHRLAAHPVSAFLDQGVHPIVEVRTRLGRTLRCTASHPILTPMGWQPIGALAPGTRVAAPRSLPIFGTEDMDEATVRLIAYILSDGSAQSSVCVTSALPEIAEDVASVARRFGMTVRTYPKPGSKACQYRLVMPPGERVAARRELAAVLRVARAEAGLSRAELARRADVPYAKLRTWDMGDAAPCYAELVRLAEAIGISVETLRPAAWARARQTTPVAELLEGFGLRFRTAADKAIPSTVFQLPAEQLRLFLKVLFSCDGSVYVAKRQAGVSYSTISHRLAQDVQHLLLRFGFVAKLRTKAQSVRGNPYTAYELQLLGTEQVRRFVDEIGIWGREEAKLRLELLPTPKLGSTHFDTVPTGPDFWAHVAGISQGSSVRVLGEEAGITLRNRRHAQPLSRRTVAALAEAHRTPYLLRLAAGDVYWDEIEEVRPAGEERVYDLAVPGPASFVAQDLIVHNSTLLTQVAGNVAREHGTTLYVSGEESVEQIKLRAARLGAEHASLLLASETDVAQIAGYVQQLKPRYVIIDSIQTMQSPDVDSAPGTVSQVRASCAALAAIAKGMRIPIFLVGHVTKEGAIAGPRVLEHMVDTVLYFEGDRHLTYRILRAVKNRFGSTDELGIFEMREEGLVGVENPSEVFLAERPANSPGSTVTATIEGTRPLLVEIQALVAPSYLTSPRRMTNGVERDRVSLVLAVLEKRVGLSLANQDVYINVAGGVEVKEPAADLAIALAVASNFKEMPVDPGAIFLGEIGLSGEVRGCSQIEKRLKEASRLGFTSAVIAKKNLGRDAKTAELKVSGVDSLLVAVEFALMPR